MTPKDHLIHATDSIASALCALARINFDNPAQSYRVAENAAGLLADAIQHIKASSPPKEG